MIEKLARAFSKLRGEVSELSQRIDSLPEPKDGVSPKAEDIAALVLEQTPTPKDGKDADAQAIVEEVLAKMPKPKDGKDAQPPLLADVAALVLAQMPKPKDGVSPDPQAIAREAAKLVPKPKDGVSPKAEDIARRVPKAKQGKPGKDGVSITDVKVERGNILTVWLDGKKKRAGKIEVPPAQPQFVGGTGGKFAPKAKTTGYTPQGTFVSGR